MAVDKMLERLEAMEKRLNEIDELLCDENVASDITRLTSLNKERSNLEDPVLAYQKYKRMRTDLEDAMIMQYDENPEIVEFAKAHGVNKIALELHPGFCVYNTDSLLRLREAVGPEIGANFDPSHLIWQGMDPVACIRKLGDAIFHFHAKDTKIDKYNTAVNGVLDTKPYGDEINRSWIFRSVGYGNDYSYWKDIISNLRMIGYDYAISIEHEDSLMSQNEGLSKAVSFLKEVLVTESTGEMWWV